MTLLPKRKNLSFLIGIIIIVAPIALGIIYIHDNLGITASLGSINSGETPVHLSSTDGNISFAWNSYHLEVGWTVIVRGTVYQWYELYPVISVE